MFEEVKLDFWNNEAFGTKEEEEEEERRKRKKSDNENKRLSSSLFISVRNFDNFTFFFFLPLYLQKLNFFLYLKRDSNYKPSMIQRRTRLFRSRKRRGKREARGGGGRWTASQNLKSRLASLLKFVEGLPYFRRPSVFDVIHPSLTGGEKRPREFTPSPLLSFSLSLSLLKINPASTALFSYILSWQQFVWTTMLENNI